MLKEYVALGKQLYDNSQLDDVYTHLKYVPWHSEDTKSWLQRRLPTQFTVPFRYYQRRY